VVALATFFAISLRRYHQRLNNIWQLYRKYPESIKGYVAKNIMSQTGSIILDIESINDYPVFKNILWKYTSFYDESANIFVRSRLLPSPSSVYEDSHRWFEDVLEMMERWYRLEKQRLGKVDPFKLYERIRHHMQNLYRGIRHIEETQKRFPNAGDLYRVEMLLYYMSPYLASFEDEVESIRKYNTDKAILFPENPINIKLAHTIMKNFMLRIFMIYILSSLEGAFIRFAIFRTFIANPRRRKIELPKIVLFALRMLSDAISFLLSSISLIVVFIVFLFPLVVRYWESVVSTKHAYPFSIITMIAAFFIILVAILILRYLRYRPLYILRYYYGALSGWGESILRPLFYLVFMGTLMSVFTGRMNEVYLEINRGDFMGAIVSFIRQIILGTVYFLGFSFSFSLEAMYKSWSVKEHLCSGIHCSGQFNYYIDLSPILGIKVPITSPYDIDFISFVVFSKLYFIIFFAFLLMALKRQFLRY